MARRFEYFSGMGPLGNFNSSSVEQRQFVSYTYHMCCFPRDNPIEFLRERCLVMSDIKDVILRGSSLELIR